MDETQGVNEGGHEGAINEAQLEESKGEGTTRGQSMKYKGAMKGARGGNG